MIFTRFLEILRNAVSGYWNGLSQPEMLATSLIAVVITGLIGGLLAKKLRQPLLLGYILAGVFAGIAYQGFGPDATATLASLANIGVALLLFTMGLEFEKKDLRPIRNVAVWGTLSQVVFTLFAGAGIAWLLNRTDGIFATWSAMLVFGTAFVSTSTAVVLKTLTSRGQMTRLSSKVMIGMSIVQDLTVIPLFMIVSSLSDFSGGLTNALKPLVLGALFMVLMLTIGARYIPLLLKFVAKFNSRELFLLAVTGVALGGGQIADCMEVSFSFGAFLVGIALSDSDFGKKALGEMVSVRDLFAMLFFVSIGMMLDTGFLLGHWKTVLAVMLATSLSRTLFLGIVTWCSGYRNVIPVAMFFGMIPTSEIAFVVIQLARQEGVFGEEVYSLVLCAVVCSMLVGPLMDSLTSPVYSLFRKTIWKNSLVAHNVTLPPPDLADHVIVAGGDNIARSIAYLLEQRGLPYLIIENSYNAYQKARGEHLMCLYGEPQQEVILRAAGIEHARLLLAASPSFRENLEVIKMANKLHPDIPVVTRADAPDEVELLHDDCRVFEIVQPKFEAGLEMTRQALLRLKVSAVEIQNYMDSVRFDHYKPLRDGMSEASMADDLRSFTGLVALNWIRIPENSPLVGRAIAESRIRSITGVSVVGVMRDRRFISNPSPNLTFSPGDILAVIGESDQNACFERMCGSELADTPAAAEHMQPNEKTPSA